MDYISAVAGKYSLKVVEDVVQGVNAYYKGKALGAIGDFGTYSFHETQNYTMGEDGALILGSKDDIIKADIIREKGTNRAEFLLGMTDKYTWVGMDSSYLPSELGAAFLYAQLNEAEQINNARLARYNQYYSGLKELEERESPRLETWVGIMSFIALVQITRLTGGYDFRLLFDLARYSDGDRPVACLKT